MARTEEAILPSSRVFDTPTVLFLLASLILLYSFLFVLPFTPIDRSLDGLFYVSDGKRMYEGEVIYRDFFQFSTPGAAIVYSILFKLFGLRLWIPNIALLLLGLGLLCLSLVVAKKLMRPSIALLSSAIFLVGVYRTLLDPTHHWYSVLCVAAALALVTERRTLARLAAAGCFCGLATCFTQLRGLAAVVGFGAFLWWEFRQRREDWREWLKKEAGLVGSFLATILAVNAYFVWKAGLTRFLWCTVVFGIEYYPKQADANTLLGFMQSLPEFRSLSDLLWRSAAWLFLYAVIPLTYILFFARYWRASGKEPVELWERPMLLAMVGSFMLLSVVPAPTIQRMGSSTLPGIILLGWFLNSPRKFARVLAGVLAGGVLLTASRGVVRFQNIERWIFTTPQGQIAIEDLDASWEYAWVQQHTRPSDYFYAARLPAGMYFYLNLRNPTPLPFITNNGYTTPRQVAEVIQGLEQHQVRYVLWPSWDLDTLPEWENPSDDHLGPLRDYIHRRYHLVRVFTNSDQIWERNN